MRTYKCDMEKHMRCENNGICHLCKDEHLYKNTQEEKTERKRKMLEAQEAEKQAGAILKTHKKFKKEGMGFEAAVQKRWNNTISSSSGLDDSPLFKGGTKKIKAGKPRIQLEDEAISIEEPSAAPKLKLLPKKPFAQDAKRQANSGAMWHSKGDIITEDYLMECKQRGSVNARGEKTISIPKEWLVKQEKEAYQENRPYWLLPFNYKNDDEIYVIKPFDQEIEMYHELKKARKEVEELKARLKGMNTNENV